MTQEQGTRKETLGVCLDPQDLEMLRALAERDERPVSAYVRKVLLAHVREQG